MKNPTSLSIALASGILISLAVTVFGQRALSTPEPASIDPTATGAVARSHSSDFGAALSSTGTIYTVPAGKRLVIENVSCMATVATGLHVSGSIGTRVGGTSSSCQTTFQLVGTGENYRRYSFNHPVRLYADPGTNVTFTTIRSGTSSQGGYTVGFSGYLVNYP